MCDKIESNQTEVKDLSEIPVYGYIAYDPFSDLIFEVTISYEELDKSPYSCKLKENKFDNISSFLKFVENTGDKTHLTTVKILLSEDVLDFDYKHLVQYYVPEELI
ncbi:hypothetical protein WCWAEYFT_CDS0155 [Vibrio phage VB_VaC_TDDLMA]